MEIFVKRIAKKADYTIGKVYINGVYLCDSIEDKDRGLKQSMSLGEIRNIKIPKQTAIPSGNYEVTLNVKSPAFSQKQFYKNYCDGRVPRLLNVPGFDGILMHCGSTQNSSAGCIILGYNTIVGRVTNSETAFKIFYSNLKAASDKGERITITIK